MHEQGYKVALTGEGADEALAGYVWYKTQAIRDAITGRIGHAGPAARSASCSWAPSAGGRPRLPPEQAIGGVRPAQQDLYELISQAKPTVYSRDDVAAAGRSQSRTTTWISPTTASAAGIRSTSRSTSATR